MISLWKIILGVALSLVGFHVLKFISFMKFGRAVFNHSPGACRLLDGIDRGSEDIQVLPDGLAFISSGLRIMNPKAEYYKKSTGKLFLFDFQQPEKSPLQLKIIGNNFDENDLNPHGLSIWVDGKDEVFLYVVNHRPDQECVEVFHFDRTGKTLTHEKTILADSNMRFLNDLIVVDREKFYFTNFAYFPHNKIEMYAFLHWGSIGFYDGKSSSIEATGLLMPNGINMSPDNKYLYVSHIGETELRVYDRLANNSLSFKKSFQVFTCMDNLDVDKTTGDIWTGAHSIPHRAVVAGDDPDKYKAPSQVLKLKMDDGVVKSVTEIYADDGAVLSGSSVAVHYKDAMLVGTVYDKLLYCEIMYQ